MERKRDDREPKLKAFPSTAYRIRTGAIWIESPGT